MIIYLNRRSNSGRAKVKWNKIRNSIFKMFPESQIIEADSFADNKIKTAIALGETEFISAGGDGTINSLINKLIKNSDNEKYRKFRIGALGLGSSNDFHKPFSERISGIPARIDFNNTEACDAGVIEYENEESVIQKRYWLINASIGILADANRYFNHQGLFWSFFKRYFTDWAIVYSALVTIALYRNKKCCLNSNDFGKKNAIISNLGIAKNPNFAGDFSYPGEFNTSNGLFSLFLMENKSTFETLMTLLKLRKSKEGVNLNIHKYDSDSLEVSSDKHFNVEFDGEVISTTRVKFSIINKAVMLCK